MIATPESVGRASRREKPQLTLHPIASYQDLEPFREEFDRAYYRGYTRKWAAPFSWGERAVVGTVQGRLACYNWIQDGSSGGFPIYYGRVFEGEARVLRAGVLPEFRGTGLNAAMKHSILADLFARGVRRVYVECYLYNTPSIRSLVGVGFAPVGLITVAEAWPLRNFVRWRSASELEEALKQISVSVPGRGDLGLPRGAGRERDLA